jgi:murein DD-endopeptidase MepM/ murein hydrolase activator NlpD
MTEQYNKLGFPLDHSFEEGMVDTESHGLRDGTRYALDFKCPAGTPVLAADDGVVERVENDSNTVYNIEQLMAETARRILANHQIDIDDPNLELTEEEEEHLEALIIKTMGKISTEITNFVVIKHQDGTFTEYLHLGSGKDVGVKIGDPVYARQQIARTGMSGVMTVAHLHFNRYRVEEDGEEKKAIGVKCEFLSESTNSRVRDVISFYQEG